MGGVTKKQYIYIYVYIYMNIYIYIYYIYIHIGGKLPKSGAWTVCRFKGGGLAKESNAFHVDY